MARGSSLRRQPFVLCYELQSDLSGSGGRGIVACRVNHPEVEGGGVNTEKAPF